MIDSLDNVLENSSEPGLPELRAVLREFIGGLDPAARMIDQQRLVVPKVAVGQAEHQPVAERIKRLGCAGLRNAVVRRAIGSGAGGVEGSHWHRARRGERRGITDRQSSRQVFRPMDVDTRHRTRKANRAAGPLDTILRNRFQFRGS